MESQRSQEIRVKIFNWLNQVAILNDYVLDWRTLTKGFKIDDIPVPLIGAKGIWKPKVLDEYPISITSVEQSIYSDKIVSEDEIEYSYRGIEISHPDNVGLRKALRDKIPLIYLHQLSKGFYYVAWPFLVVQDKPEELKFIISADSADAIYEASTNPSEPDLVYRRKYQTRQVLSRLHQKSFREQVLNAYRSNCAICKLQHRSLLDAAHIIPDSQGGLPEVQNGLSLCKIHHAAYDQNIIGINPDYIINVREDILEEIDGPMLKYGLQETNNQRLILPRKRNLYPNRDYLAQRFDNFSKAS